MTKGRELFALEWVKGEILGTLDSARQSLEAYAEFGRDETRMRVCLTGLHQVHGSLVMLELPGIALLADHLERLAQALLNGSCENEDPACQLLMQGILELPIRLERIQEGHPDAAGNVLGMVNAARVLLGLEPMDVPRPVQFEAGEAALDRFERIDGAGKIRRIRSAYQGVLLKLLKGERPPEFIETLRKVGTGLERICQDTPSEILWQCFGEFVDSLAQQSGPVSGESMKALRRVDAEIRRFGQEGIEAILAPVPEKLLEQLLGMAASGGRSSARLETLRSRIQPVDSGELIASGREALVAASHALVDELAVVKDQIDLLVRSDNQSGEPLAAMLPVLNKLASTCSLLGFESSRVLILQQTEIISQAIAGATTVSRDLLFGIAAALLQVEENFKALSAPGGAESSHGGGVGVAEKQLLAEARAVLEGIKQAVVGFVGNGFDRVHLDGVPRKLHDVASVLSIAGFSRPASLLEDCRAFLVLEIAGYQTGDASIPWERLDRFADCLSGVDYHLERIENRSGGRAEDILDIVERNLASAGYLGRGAQTPVETLAASPVPENSEALAEEALAPIVEELTTAAPTEPAFTQEAPSEEVPSETALPEEAPPQAALAEDNPVQPSAEPSGLSSPLEPVPVEVQPQPDEALEVRVLAQADTPVEADTLLAPPQAEGFAMAALSPIVAIDSGALPEAAREIADTVQDSGLLSGAALDDGPASSPLPSPDLLAQPVAGDVLQEDTQPALPAERLDHDFGAQSAESASQLEEQPGERSQELPENRLEDGQEDRSGEAAAEISGALPEVSLPADVVAEVDLAELLAEPYEGVPAWTGSIIGPADAVAETGHGAEAADFGLSVNDAPVPERHLEWAEEPAAEPVGIDGELSAFRDSADEAREDTTETPGAEYESFDLGSPALNDAAATPVSTTSLDSLPLAGDLTPAPLERQAAATGLPLEFDLSDSRFDVFEQLPTAAASGEDSADDDEIRGIFLEEATEVLAAVQEHIGNWRNNLDSIETLREIRRCFHTLKGSGRVAGAAQVGELAWAIENMLNRVLDGTIAANAEFIQVAAGACQLMPELLQAFAARTAVKSERIGNLIESADQLASGGSAHAVEDDIVSEAADVAESEERLLFFAELKENLSLLRNKTGRRRVQIDDELLMALHTITGSAGLVGEVRISRLSELLYDVARNSQAEVLRGPSVDVDVARLFQDCVDTLERLLPVLRMGAGEVEVQALDAVAARASEILERVDASPSEEGLLELPELDVVMNARAAIVDWGRGQDEGGFRDTFNSAMHAILGATFRPQITDIAKALLSAMRSLESVPALPPLAQSALIDGCDRILQVVDAIATDRVLPRVDDVVTRLGDLASGVVDDSGAESTVVVALPEREKKDAGTAATAPVAALPLASTRGGWSAVDERFIAQLQREAEQMDADLADVFFEESDEILEGLESSVDGFRRDAQNLLHLENILRGLHTLKGSSRLAGLALFGDRVHQFESVLSALQIGEGEIDQPVREETQGRFDEILNLVQVAREAFRRKDDVLPDQAGALSTQPERPVLQRTHAAADAAHVVREGHTTENALVSSVESAPDMVRVRATLLENLVNLAGESSILRARVEQGISDFTTALDEMETTIDRVSEQLRRLELETDAQVLYRVERTDRRHAHFDPLEMDRYSQLQQLTRALSESASDMRDLKDTLLLRSREAETILLQQARVNTELQEGLMRTRMVPFTRLLPRLNRIVRQVATELGKDVEFHVFNAEGELDRNLLERMVPPLEHMLRNAVDHGIESNNVRRSFGKPVPGRIDLRLSREGGDIVIEIGDDGMGIDVESVRAKAMERGLMRPGAVLSDEEALEFVLAPGFSTAKSVTQISGRGVGLDVVNSEVKQLGGSVSIFSTAGKGTRFVLRVPFTVSVNRALMVTVGDDQYAIPLNTIEGIVLVDAAALKAIYASEDKLFEYAGLAYRVRYLGRYLGRDEPALSQRGGVPLVLVRAGEQSVAIAVDGVQGSREIVVKSLGPQFAGVGGISGATILGDGSVVIILDLVALIRSQGREVIAAVTREGTGTLRPRCVMVVDDSVTVRKVTTRLLERQGMDVIVAKDGVEAMALLGERTPDVMLLDIEMPRMDGFEVARQVRHDHRIAELPIIMISSRTGEKHQEHARSLQINRFLGKPFQENELLAAIEELAERS